jgi:hypothetical protein
MIYALIGLAVVAVLFAIFKNKIKLLITKKVQEKNKAKEDNDDFIFIPVGMTRSFSINFTIEETGGGKARITVSKSAL